MWEAIDCIGPRTGGRLIAFLTTPARFQGKSLFHSCGHFHAFARTGTRLFQSTTIVIGGSLTMVLPA